MKFTFHETGHMAIAFALPGEKGLQMSGDNSINGIFFGMARTVGGIGGHAGMAESKWSGNCRRNRVNSFRARRRREIRTERDKLSLLSRVWRLLACVSRRVIPEGLRPTLGRHHFLWIPQPTR